MVLPIIFATLTAGNQPAANLDTNFTFLEKQGVQGLATTGSSNAYILTPPDAWITGYSSYIARALTVLPNFTNTGASTVNVSSLSNASIYKNIGGIATALSAGDIKENIPAILICDGTNFLLTNPTSSFSISPTFRNGLINGDMAIAQRNTTFTGISIAPPVQVLDCWFAWTDGASSMTVSQQPGVIANTGFNNVLRAQRPNGNTSVSTHRIGQIIKSVDCTRFAGQTVTLSFYARKGADFSAASSNLIVRCLQGTGTNQGSTAYTTGGWSGTSLALNTTQALTASLTRYTFTFTILSNSTELAFDCGFLPVGTAGTNDYFDIVGVQLENGGVATGYEYLTFDQQLQRCLPYYFKTFPYATVPAQAASTGTIGAWALVSPAAASFGASFDYPIPMFQVTQGTTYNPISANANWRDTTNNADRAVSTVAGNSDRIVIVGATGAVNAVNYIHFTAEGAL